MAKGSIILVNCFGSVGGIVKDFDSKEVVTGSYRHSQTVGGVTYSWKCAKMELTGVVKLVEDEYEGRVFYRMEGLVNEITTVNNIKSLAEELKGMDF
jgi:hypothetical protein